MTASLNPYLSRFDKGLDVGNASQYSLTIQFSLGGLSFALLDARRLTFIGLECYQSDRLTDGESLFMALERALASHDLNGRDFAAVTCLVDERTSTLVPSTLFDVKDARKHLDFTFQLTEGQAVLSETLDKPKCVNVFAVDSTLLQKIRSKWPDARISHSSSTFIISSLDYVPEGKAAFVNVKNRDFDMAIVDERRLAFFNNFKFNTKDDFAYFLLFALEQNGYSGLELPVCFSGLILPASEIATLCSRYVKRLAFVECRHELQVSEALDDVPFQYYYIHYQLFRNTMRGL